jgi:hypothetical protein
MRAHYEEMRAYYELERNLDELAAIGVEA